jgi:polyhydroxybutyrate depolymerase
MGPAAPAGAQTGADPCGAAPAPGDSVVSLAIGGRERTALIHVPPAAAGQSLPLVVALHSGGGLAPWFESYTGLSQIADAAGFIVVYPNGAGYQHFWTINDHDPNAPDDVGFVNSLLDQTESGYCINPRRVYAFGVSNGGGMAVRLGCELAGRFAAIATVAGGYRSQPSCSPVLPVSVLEVHGTSDGSVPYDGMPPDHAGSVNVFLQRWVALDRCRRAATRRRIGIQALRLDWTSCAGGAAIEHIEIIGGGHQLPGAMPPDKGPRSTISVPWLVWGFLRNHQRVPPAAAGAPSGGAAGSTKPAGTAGAPAGASPVAAK